MKSVNNPASACYGKEAFETAATAARAAKALNRRKRITPLEHYRCSYCGQFHIGNRSSVTRWLRTYRLPVSNGTVLCDDGKDWRVNAALERSREP